MATQSFTLPLSSNPYAAQQQDYGMEAQSLQQALMELQQQQESAAYGRPVQAGALSTLNFAPITDQMKKAQLKAEQEVNRKKQLDLSGKYQEEVLRQLSQYRKDKAPSEQEVAGPTQDGGPLTKVVPGNQQSFEQYLNSPYPEVRAQAERDAKLYESRLAEALKHASLGSIQQSGGDITRLDPQRKYQEVGGVLADTTEGHDPSLAPGMGYTQEKGPNGEVRNRNLFSNKLEEAGGVKINMPGANLVNEKIKALEPLKAQADASARTLRSTEQALDVLAKGAKAGYGQDAMQNVRTAITGITGIQFDATTPTGVLAKTLASNVLDEFGGKLGTGVSNADVLFMKEAAGGLATDPKALERILAIRTAAAYNRIQEYNGTVDTLAALPQNDLGLDATKKLYRSQMPNFGYVFQTPEARASFGAGIANRPFEEFLKMEQEAQKGPQGGLTAPGPGGKDWRKDPAERARRLKELGIGG